MKKYLAPEIELLYLSNEDVLTTSDPYAPDPYDPAEEAAEG